MSRYIILGIVICLCFSIFVCAGVYQINRDTKYIDMGDNTIVLSNDCCYTVENNGCTDDTVDNLESLFEVNVDPVNELTLYQTQHYSTYYFSNLRNKMGLNYIGSCSYIAIAMMLSYYDTYWNDSIIPEEYDGVCDSFRFFISGIYESPGIKENEEIISNEEDRLGLESNEKLDFYQYYELATKNSGDYLQYKLIEIGREKEIYKMYSFFHINPFGLGLNGRSELIESYLYDYMGFLESEISYETVVTNVEEYIIDNVAQGIPVLISVGFSNGLGHALVAYDYDYETGNIYANMGWRGGDTHIILSSLNYSLIKNATTFIVNLPHSHSNNYLSTDGTAYCSCYFSCHPEHVCSYETYDYTQHIYTCNCVYKNVNKFPHDCTYSNSTATNHLEECFCGYSRISPHNYTTHAQYSATHHIEACECGATGTVTSPHVISAAEAGLRMAFCMLCGQRVLVDNTIIQVPGTNALVTMPRSANGSYVLPNGIIVLVDEDVEAYFAGTLVFYDGENAPVTE